MTLKNVERIETQEIHKKTWFQKFRNKLSPVAVATGGMIVANAHAEAPDFLGEASTSLGAIAVNLGALFVIAIGITLTIMAFTLSRGGIKKAG